MVDRKTKRIQKPKKCPFCVDKKNPSFAEYEVLGRFLSERGKILNRLRSGVCAKHQRKLAKEIKRARFLSLLA